MPPDLPCPLGPGPVIQIYLSICVHENCSRLVVVLGTSADATELLLLAAPLVI